MLNKIQDSSGAVTTANALKMAIEALETAFDLAFKEKVASPIDEYHFESALIKCKEALAQPAQEPVLPNHRWSKENEMIESWKQTAQEPVAWDDKQDEWSDEIAQSHPLKTKRNIEYDIARKMVSNRHSKGALVDLVCWLLQKQNPAPAREPVEDTIICASKILAYLGYSQSVSLEPSADERRDKIADIIANFYTHPAPAWQGLESEKVTQIIHGLEDKLGMPIVGAIAVARAIEQALKEKNA